MPYEHGTDRNALGWLDVHDYLAELRSTTGRGWCVCIAATGEQSRTKHLLLSVCEYRAGAPIVRDDIALTAGHWPNGDHRRMESAVYELLHRFDRRLEERANVREIQSAF